MKYRELTEKGQLENIVKESREYPHGVLIFKHSTRCAISSMAYQRLNRNWKMAEEDLPVYYLDILRHRDISGAVAEKFGIQHESPQALLIKDGECVYNSSHSAIQPEVIEEEAVNA